MSTDFFCDIYVNIHVCKTLRLLLFCLCSISYCKVSLIEKFLFFFTSSMRSNFCLIKWIKNNKSVYIKRDRETDNPKLGNFEIIMRHMSTNKLNNLCVQ